MRWLVIVLLVSVALLLIFSAGAARHIWREHKSKQFSPERKQNAEIETEEAP